MCGGVGEELGGGAVCLRVGVGGSDEGGSYWNTQCRQLTTELA